MISKQNDGSLWLSVYIQPGASKSEIVGPHGDSLKIRIKAPPVEGKANEALVEFLSERLGISKRSVQVVKGELLRNKVVRVENVELNVLKQKLNLG